MNINLISSFNSSFLLNKDLFNKLCNYLNISIDNLDIYLVDKSEILELNQKYLNHNYYTDILTFDLRDSLSNDIALYICYSVAEDNSIKFKVSTENELLRLIIHGILHISGYNDSTPLEKEKMRNMENYFLYKLFHVKKENE